MFRSGTRFLSRRKLRLRQRRKNLSGAQEFTVRPDTLR